MSRFSGKCDFYDLIDIHGVDKILSCNIYNHKDLIPLRTESVKDLIPYYPYLTSLVNIGKNNGYIRLSRQSFIDYEEQNRLTTHLNLGIKEYKRFPSCIRIYDEILPMTILSKLDKQGLEIVHFKTIEINVEEYYLSMIGGNKND